MVTSVSKSNEYLFHDCGYSVICCISYRFVVVELRIFFLLTDVMHHFYILTVPDCELIGLECAIVRVFVLPAPKLKSSFGRIKYWSWKYKKKNNFCELRIQKSKGKSMCLSDGQMRDRGIVIDTLCCFMPLFEFPFTSTSLEGHS